MAASIITIQYIAIAILIFELIFVMFQKPSDLQKHAIILIISCILMLGGYIIEISSGNLEEALAGTVMAYIGKPFVVWSSFLFVCTLYNRRISQRLYILITLLFASFSLLVFTNSRHYLFYSSVTFDRSEPFSPLKTTAGPFYILYVVLTLIFFSACVYVTASGYRKNKKGLHSDYSIYVLLMISSGVTGYVFYLTGITGGYDTTMLGILGGELFLFILFLRGRIFDALTMAKDLALESSDMGLVVFNSNGDEVYRNRLFDSVADTLIPMSYIRSLNMEHSVYKSGEKAYSLTRRNLGQGRNQMGYSVEVGDISGSVKYQDALELQVRERTDALETMQRSVLASVASIVEARSAETGLHILRTAEYTRRVAEYLRDHGKYLGVLTEEYISTLSATTPLHDIGKIAVSDAILQKPGPLTPEEYEQMKKHTTEGVNILEKSMRGMENDTYVDLAEEIAMYHHERWDGTGYPEGLQSYEIPLSARIVALADVYDALTSERCYKPPYSREKSIEILRQETGTHFDPDVAEAFITVVLEMSKEDPLY